MRVAAISSVLALVFSLSAQGGLYTYNYSDSGPIPQGGTTLSFEHTIGGIEPIITSIELILTFQNNHDLNGSILGTLILDPGGSATYQSFAPSATQAGTGGQKIYDVTWTIPFATFNPNNIWALNLWDSSTSGIENSLVSWTLEITAVPEPVNVALGIFAGVFAVGGLCRTQPVRKRIQRCWAGVNQWLDAV
jgi:hypothetical protein